MAIEDRNAEELRLDLAKWEAALVDAEAAAAKVVALRSLVKTLREALSVIEGKPAPSPPNPQKYARMRLPESIMDYLEEHRYPVDIVKELIPALIAGGAMTGRRKPDAPLKDNVYPLRAVMVTMYTLAKDAKVTLNKKTRVVEIR